MRRRRWLIWAGLGLAALLVFALLPVASRRYHIELDERRIGAKQACLAELSRANLGEGRPNVLLIVADDLGKTDLSLYGGTQVQTQRIDGLGREGVVFTEAYSTSPLCSPSRAAMLTGRYQQRFGHELQMANRYPRNRLEYAVFRYLLDLGHWKVAPLAVPRKEDVARQGLPPSEITLGELLQAGGYDTALIGKWHLGHNAPFLPNQRGFAYHYGFYEAFTLYDAVDDPDVVNRRLDEFSDRYQWGQGRKGTSAIRVNDQVVQEDGYLTDRIAEEAVRFLEAGPREQPFFLYVAFSAPHVPYQALREDYERFGHIADPTRRIYAAMVYSLDRAVGRILDGLAELGLERDTLVMFASDNGGAFHTGATDNAPLKGGKFTQFEGGLNVPLILRWPGVVPAGATVGDPVSLMDVFATAAAAARCPLPEERTYDGVDLLPYLGAAGAGPPGGPMRPLFWRAEYSKAVRLGDWKLLWNAREDKTWLYNLAEDPEERHNLSTLYPRRVQELQRAIRCWEEALIPPLWPRVMDFEVVIDGEVYRFAI